MRLYPFLAIASSLALLCLEAQSQTKPAAKPAAPPAQETSSNTLRELPVRQVVLYKNGVGYFEHFGSVTGNQRVAIDFTSSQLNDVLQSLTVLDEGGGHIAGINYNSTMPLGEQLKSLSLGMDDDPTSTELYHALRGQRVEVTGANGGPITGRLMAIESRPEKGTSGETTTDHFYLTLVANSGAVRVIELTPALSVRPLDASLQGQLDRYLDLLRTTHATGLRHLTLNALGQGQRGLRVSYISEIPVWKSTYRIVFPQSADAAAILQGWAVVDNTIGADWDNVQLSLVAGAPQSFIQPLSQPLYLRRPEIAISTTAMTTPQTHEAAEMNTVPSPAAVPVASGPSGSQYMTVPQRAIAGAMGGLGSGSGNGYGPGTGGNVGGGIYSIHSKSRASDAFREGDITTNAFDDFFQYTLTEPVTIHKNESAMVPILQEKLPAEHVTIWNETERSPVRAIWLENTSKLTFDSGSFSVFESGAFAGEGLLDPIHPGEKRLLSYAADQAVRVRFVKNEAKREIRKVHIGSRETVHGLITKTYAAVDKRTYQASNSADEPRLLVVEVPRQHGRNASPETKAAETTASLYRFRLPVAAHQSATLLAADEGPEVETWKIEEDNDQVVALENLAEEVPAIADKLKPIISAQQAIQDMKTQLQQFADKMTSLTGDEARARENLTALKGNDAGRRFVDELNHAEDELESTRKQNAELFEKRKAAVESLRQTLLTLEIDWSSPTQP
jgi:hypothetical protein